MDTTRIERDLRMLKLYAGAMTLVVGVLSLAAFTRSSAPTQVGEIQGTKAKFDVIDVERINVLEPDGKYRLILSNRPRSIGPIYKMKPFGYEGGGRPGMIWFNDEGTENGGFTFTGSSCTAGKLVDGRNCREGEYRASTHMSFDQFNQDQVLNFDYSDRNGRRAGALALLVDDREIALEAEAVQADLAEDEVQRLDILHLEAVDDQLAGRVDLLGHDDVRSGDIGCGASWR